MAKKTMRKLFCSVSRTNGRHRTKKVIETVTHTSPTMVEVIASTPKHGVDVGLARAEVAVGATMKGKKKTGGSRLWMRFDRFGQSELLECDKSVIIKLAAIPTRDLRILGPVFSHSSNILARENAMVVNLEFIKAIVTAEEVFLLDPLRQEVLPFVDQLKQHLPLKNQFILQGYGSIDAHESEIHLPHDEHWYRAQDAVEESKSSLPFEFQVLEIALEAVCSFLDSTVEDLERNAHPVLDELARNVSNKNLEHVRSLKSNLTRLLARVQKVRDEIEHLLDDNEDMSQLYLTRRTRVRNQQTDTSFAVLPSADPPTGTSSTRQRFGSNRSVSLATNNSTDNDVEDLEMLLEAYFMQLDATRNKILSVREYIGDTEDYVNIQLDNQRNELIQLQLTLTIASFALAADTLLAGLFGMNIPCILYTVDGIFPHFLAISSAATLLLFLLLLAYARCKNLIGS